MNAMPEWAHALIDLFIIVTHIPLVLMYLKGDHKHGTCCHLDKSNRDVEDATDEAAAYEAVMGA